MGIVNIDDDLHGQIRKGSSVSHRSINAQAMFGIKIGMLEEMNPTLSFNALVVRALRAAGIMAGNRPGAARRHGVHHEPMLNEDGARCAPRMTAGRS